ncbi:hypothetical protein MGYG_07182 [Nannizzia gypsea CBS 118893]|uniref:VWFA domain-containing protein n=1 Tax=Arthroderma gypseum (strain ATCC MYA-4604 / CBS 118893) TaxID=535722 RepID=E4V2B0_ARTGP|nr:hypothetical protein MGYG_07182 [Nannizzia gypsea CBS 118893]EFR04175.1 hypothetical protein MGYG_07182 [Nannizzia gypsea CBS 118893]
MPLFGSSSSSSRSKSPLSFLNRNKQHQPAQKTSYSYDNKSMGSSHLGPPPAYTPVSASSTTAPSFPAPASESDSLAAGRDQADSFLTQFDTVFLIDDSGSMQGPSWEATENALAKIAPICTARDKDGVEIYFLNHRSGTANGAYSNVRDTGHVREVFTAVTPYGGTPTGTRLNHILKPYLKGFEEASKSMSADERDRAVRPLNIIVITDGVPTDDVESVIIQAAKKLDKLNAVPWQVGIQFFQVGNDPEAAEDLKELDDALAGQNNIRDMVDTVPWDGTQVGGGLNADGVLKVVLGAVHKKYDRKNALVLPR